MFSTCSAKYADSCRFSCKRKTILSTTATAFCQGSPSPIKREVKFGAQNGEPTPDMPLRNNGGSAASASHSGNFCSTSKCSSCDNQLSALPAPLTVPSST